jgi:hypothetical protein
MYTVALSDLTDIFQRGSCSTITDGSIAAAAAEPPRTEPSSDEFREQRRRKRNISSDGEVRSVKKPAQPEPEKTKSRNYFAPLRTAEMDIKENSPAAERSTPLEQQTPSPKKGRPPPIVLTSPTNLISPQRNLKGLVRDNFEFRSTGNGIRVVTREMEDYQSVRKHFDSNNLNYFTFHPKSENQLRW